MTKRKKTTPKKTTRRKNTKTNKSNIKLINFLLFIIILLLIAIGFLIYTIDTNKLKETKKEIPKVVKNIEKKVKETNDEFDKYFEQIEKIKKDKFEEYTKDFYKEYSDTEEIKTIKKKEDNKRTEEKPKVITTNKPKLAIIFDDVTTEYQINKIKDIGYTTTLSVMPPTKRHPDSAKITKDLPFYMIHLPLEARVFKNEETSTLHVNDSYEKVEKRVAQIRKLYPNAKYTNNHTGSKFTANEQAMDYLFKALKKYDFIFVDSRTTSKSVAKKMAKKYNMPYISRNVFLDNEQDFKYIQGQLKKAINIAKKNGSAIAICHPHSITIKTLKESKFLLDGLDMIYLNQLPSLLN
ncbi:divergent polysaccharide deacetylase family protein [Halarcobacter sp.]|uniref:divergent polysaccharide deacetylase family protein n=1 Tax=Halarcobacter sp. TaxID=2321133 RepID=UPI002AAC290E|nr:divergent polysaccharide deacetylase family protein [Halarcobacter sp.]